MEHSEMEYQEKGNSAWLAVTAKVRDASCLTTTAPGGTTRAVRTDASVCAKKCGTIVEHTGATTAMLSKPDCSGHPQVVTERS